MREHKGNSIIAFPEEYVVIDIETTGRSPEYDDIIEIAALKIRGGSVVDKFSSFVRPPCNIPKHITALTGITDEMVASAPCIADVLSDYFAFIGNSVVVGHNVSNFDVNFLYDVAERCGIAFPNDHIDTLRISRKLFPDKEHHRLADMASEFGIVAEYHRALADCDTTFKLFCALKELALQKYPSEEEFVKAFRHKSKPIDLANIVPQTDDFDDTHPLYKKYCAFTGALQKMKRADALQLVANFGGIPQTGLNKDTNYLILGNLDYVSNVKGEKTNKLVKAEAMQLKGMDITIIPEDVFYDMIKEE